MRDALQSQTMLFVKQLLDGYAAQGKPMLLPKLVKTADCFTAGLPLFTQRGKGFVKHFVRGAKVHS
jgi:hypothetical protein